MRFSRFSPRVRHCALHRGLMVGPVVGLMLGLVWAPGCKKKSAQDLSAAQVQAIDVPDNPLPAPRVIDNAEVLGHFKVANFSQLLAALKPLAPPAQAERINEAALRQNLKEALQVPVLADKLAFDHPFGCAIVDPMANQGDGQWPAACVLSYQGGVEAFLADTKHLAKDDAAGHKAYLRVDGQAVYVDALTNQDRVILSGAPTIFAQTQGYLQATFEQPASFGDPEVVIHLHDVYQKYAPTFMPFVNLAMAGTLQVQNTGDAAKDQLAASVAAHQKAQVDRTLATFNEIDQLAIGFNFGREDVAVQVGVVAIEPAPILQETAALASQKLDLTLLTRLPAKSMALWAGGYDLDGALKSNGVNQSLAMARTLIATYAGEATAVAFDRYVQIAREVAKVHGPALAMAMWGETKSVLGGMTVMSILPEQNARAVWAKVLAENATAWQATPLKEMLDVKFQAAARQVDGVDFDRLTFALTPKGEQELKQRLGNAAFADVTAFLGPWRLEIEVAQLGQTMVQVYALADVSEHTARAVAALKGHESLASRPEFSSVAKLLAGNNVGAAVDLKASTAWLATHVKPQAVEKVPQLGADLRDFTIRMRSMPRGDMIVEARTTTRQIQEFVAQAPSGK